jgi:hypothetical protein
MRKIALVISLGIIILVCGVSNATIIDINSRSNSLSNPVELSLAAGTYTLETIGVGDGGLFNAWSAWRSSNCSDPNGCQRTRPTTFTGYLTSFYVSSPFITSASVEGVNLVPSNIAIPLDNYLLDTPASTLLHIESGLTYPDPLSALAAAQSVIFSLSDPGIVGFSITDSPTMLSDNRGGLSLRIESSTTAIPEPSVSLLLGLGLLCISAIKRKFPKSPKI